MLVAALDTATLTLSCALVDLVAGAPPRLRCERNIVAAGRSPSSRTIVAGGRSPSSRAPPGPPLARDSDPRRSRDHLSGPPGGPGQPPPAAPALARGGHSAELPQALVDLLRAEGLGIPDVEGYAVGLGPGSFTGLRIGLATWKGLAYANRRPIAGGSSLAAMAHAAAADAEEGTLLVPLLDARKGEVYAGFYRTREGRIVEVADEAALAPEALVARVAALVAGGARPAGFGEGYEAHAGALAASLPRLRTEIATPPAHAVAAVVAERLAGSEYDAQALFALEPHYVRASEAELKYPKGLGPGAGEGR